MFSDKDDDIVDPEKLAIYRKGKEIFDMVSKIADLIPEENEHLNSVKGFMLQDACCWSLVSHSLISTDLSHNPSCTLRPVSCVLLPASCILCPVSCVLNTC